MNLERIYFLVKGNVQGVGFRAFTKHQAEELDIIGWVRNLRDGRVEGLAMGTPQALEEFKIRLKKGPALSRVDSFMVENIALNFDDRERGFLIEKTGESVWQKS